jgi:hypothetical protein
MTKLVSQDRLVSGDEPVGLAASYICFPIPTTDHEVSQVWTQICNSILSLVRSMWGRQMNTRFLPTFSAFLFLFMSRQLWVTIGLIYNRYRVLLHRG